MSRAALRRLGFTLTAAAAFAVVVLLGLLGLLALFFHLAGKADL